MPKQSKIRELQKESGKTLVEFLSELYQQYGSQYKVAGALGVSRSTLSAWVKRAGLREHTTLVPREVSNAS